MMQKFTIFIIAIVIAWFLTLGINRTLFNNTDINIMLQGEIKIADTDIGNQCGVTVNPNTLVSYKLNEQGRIIYLCPLSLWPIQREVTAMIATPALRKTLNARQLTLLDTTYPEPGLPPTQPTQQPVQPMMQTPAFH